jgi:hypothetical protein
MDGDLFDAILAMDSYNRGYNADLVFGSNLGNSTAQNGITQIGKPIPLSSLLIDYPELICH